MAGKLKSPNPPTKTDQRLRVWVAQQRATDHRPGLAPLFQMHVCKGGVVSSRFPIGSNAQRCQAVFKSGGVSAPPNTTHA